MANKGFEMDIWFAANIPEDSYGGVGRSMRELSEGLKKCGYRTTIVFGDTGMLGCNYLVFALKLCVRLLANVGNPPAWIIARSTDGVLCAAAVKILRLKTKVALHNHGWEEYAYEMEQKLPRTVISSPTSWKARVLRFPLLRASLLLCDCCLSGTLFETRWLARRYPRLRKKMRYLPNGVGARQDQYWPKDREAPLNILAVGGLTWKKNIEHSIAVFNRIADRMPEAGLFLIGAGFNKGDAPQVLKDLWRDKEERIVVVPEEKPEHMSKWYTQCPFVISSSRFEGGHSLVILEALSYGCVVFATDLPSTKEIISHAGNGILIGGVSAEDDAKVIIDMVDKKDPLANIRQNAYRTARRNRWERQVGRLEDILCMKQ
jgi:glycosyltransferase involved in cell wall biosynthesis